MPNVLKIINTNELIHDKDLVTNKNTRTCILVYLSYFVRSFRIFDHPEDLPYMSHEGALDPSVQRHMSGETHTPPMQGGLHMAGIKQR